MVVILDNTPRHPEKRGLPDAPSPPKPDWIRVSAPPSDLFERTRAQVRAHSLVTICDEAACPNIGTCWARGHASFMILGEICTRACAFCNVRTGKPQAVDATEPARLAAAVRDMGLSHVVITSVDRDDLADGGAGHFAATIAAIRAAAPETSIEVLTPDFLRKGDARDIVIDAAPDVFNHNLETVPRLYPTIRPGARYVHSLELLRHAKRRAPSIFTKSGLMVGLGETRGEILQVMDDMRAAEVDFITIGQYLQPTPKHAPVIDYVPPEVFDEYADTARAKGFLMVSATPFTRSSYHADSDFQELKARR